MADPTQPPNFNITSDLPPTQPDFNPEREAYLKEEKTKYDQELKERAQNPFWECIENKTFHTNYDICTTYDEEGKPQGFKPAVLALWIKEHEQFKTDYQTGIIYFYDGKCWVPNAEPYLEKMVAKILGKENKLSHFNNVLHDLRGLTYAKIEFSRKIACENVLLDPETQTSTPFNEKDMPLHAIPVKYDPEAKCPNWEAFIQSVVNPDDLPIIQEWSGFLLLPDYRFHKILWIVGTGRNGKGVWQRTIETILGEKNISGIALEELDGNHRFALKQLYGKLFNPCSEPTTTKTLQTPLLKKATGQDTIEAEIKGKQQRLQFRNYAKITVLANKFPKVNDQTTAFKERRLFIKFPFEFTGKNQIQNIETTWLTINDEKSGILNWMLQGLKRLLEQGYFTESKTQQETEAEFLKASDSINAFLTEMSIFDKNRVTSRSEAYESYKNYCDIFGLEAENEKKFTAKLKDTPRIGVTTISKPQRERAWKGFGLKQIDDEGNISFDNTLVTDVTGKGGFYTPPIFQQKNVKYIGDRIPVTSDTSVTIPDNSSILEGHFCGAECGNYNKPSCPLFSNKISKDNPLPLKCYGFTNPLPSQEDS